MSHPAQCEFRPIRPLGRIYFAALAAWVLALVFCAADLRAQEAPPNAIGRVAGPDLTVENGSATGAGLPSPAPSIYVLPGSVVTVHSGQAQLTFFDGGKLDICGPAKFTVLESSGAVTLALNFGKLRIQLPASIALRIYTPTIIATPLEIGGGLRDVTVGLDLQDSMCVHPATGALQLESQFTGEKIIVPENSEFFLAAGKLAPVAGVPGSCQCLAAEVAATPPSVAPAIAAASTKPIPLSAPTPVTSSEKASPTAPEIDAPAATYVVPIERPNAPPKPAAEAKDARANAPAPHPAESEARVQPPPAHQASTPGLSFAAPSGVAPTQPSVETLLLVTQARVEPEYEFHGEVAPEFVSAMRNALGEKPAASLAPAGATETAQSSTAPEPPPKKKGGFWASLKRVFGGS